MYRCTLLWGDDPLRTPTPIRVIKTGDHMAVKSPPRGVLCSRWPNNAIKDALYIRALGSRCGEPTAHNCYRLRAELPRFRNDIDFARRELNEEAEVHETGGSGPHWYPMVSLTLRMIGATVWGTRKRCQYSYWPRSQGHRIVALQRLHLFQSSPRSGAEINRIPRFSYRD